MQGINRDLLTLRIEEIAQYDISENNVYGSSYLVSQNGEIVYRKNFGITNPQSNIPVTKNTIYRLASMTKPVTAIAALLLVDRGLLSLSDPVKKYIPEFETIHITSEDGADFGIVKRDVTVLHLLTHTSGIGSGNKESNMTNEDKQTIQNTVDFFVKAGLDYEPSAKSCYSPFGAFDVLAAVIEKVSGRDYEEFLKQELLLPCNMKDTTFVPSQSQWKRMITMHNKLDGKSCVGKTTENCVFESFPCSHKLAGAGLISTLDDYAHFARMLSEQGKIGDERLISEETFRLLTFPHATATETESWGLGVRVITNESYDTLPVGSFGWSGAYGTHFWVDPKNKITAILLKNSRFDGGSGNQSAQRFEKAVYDAL